MIHLFLPSTPTAHVSQLRQHSTVGRVEHMTVRESAARANEVEDCGGHVVVLAEPNRGQLLALSVNVRLVIFRSLCLDADL
jgi:hypothetical protein